MPIKYYPLTLIIPNQYTRGGEYATPDGREYVGRYYKLYDGSTYTGINPVLGTNIKLQPIQQEAKEHEYNLIQTYDTVAYGLAKTTGVDQNSSLENDRVLTELTPYYPKPSETDYQRGYFTRYFAKIVSGPGYVFEISKTDWTKIQNGDIEVENILGYESISMLWQLTGPLRDTRVSQYQITGGVFDTNKRVTETKNKVFNGLEAYIGGDYIKFARITP